MSRTRPMRWRRGLPRRRRAGAAGAIDMPRPSPATAVAASDAPIAASQQVAPKPWCWRRSSRASPWPVEVEAVPPGSSSFGRGSTPLKVDLGRTVTDAAYDVAYDGGVGGGHAIGSAVAVQDTWVKAVTAVSLVTGSAVEAAVKLDAAEWASGGRAQRGGK